MRVGAGAGRGYALVATTLIAAAGGWLAARQPGEGAGRPISLGAAGVMVVRGRAPAPVPTTFPPASVPPADADPGDAVLAARIASAVDLPAATWRGVRRVDAGRAACGEMAHAARGSYHRFVWIDGPSLLAVDDGGADFARLARVCSGTSLDQLAAEAS